MKAILFRAWVCCLVCITCVSQAIALEEAQTRIRQVDVLDTGLALVTDAGVFVTPEAMNLRDIIALKEHGTLLMESGEEVRIRYAEIPSGNQTSHVVVDLRSDRYGYHLVDAETAALDGNEEVEEESWEDIPLQDPAGEPSGILPGTVLTRDVKVDSVNHEQGLLLLTCGEGEVVFDTLGDASMLQAIEEAATLAMIQGQTLNVEMVAEGVVNGVDRYRARKVSGQGLEDLVLPGGM